MEEHELTDEERRAIASLKRLAKKWPKSLWLFVTSGDMHVMKGRGEVPARGDYRTSTTEPDRRDVVDTISGIDCDGGDF